MPDAAAAAGPAISTLAQTVLGALLIITVLVAVAAIYVLVRVQNDRVKDHKEMSDKLEASHSKMVEAFSAFRSTIVSLEETEKSSRDVMQAMRDKLVELSTVISSCPRR